MRISDWSSDVCSSDLRDRLLAALALILGAAFCLGLPFALQAGAEFFLPLTAAIVIAIALVPLLECLERRGLPSALAAFFALVTFLASTNAAIRRPQCRASVC